MITAGRVVVEVTVTVLGDVNVVVTVLCDTTVAVEVLVAVKYNDVVRVVV